MSKLERLIEELCPDGVEYLTTSQIKKDSFWLMPATPNFLESGIPYITSKNIKNNVINFDNVKYISKDDYLKLISSRKIEENDLLITMIGTIGEAAFVGEFTTFYGQNMYLLRLDDEIINRKFYYYYFTSYKIKSSIITKKNTSSQGYIKAGSIENLKIPVPPLPIQEEIVRILDSFTELKAQLEEELEARKKQYEWYRDTFLNFNNNVIKKSLSDLCIISAGGDIPKNALSNEKDSFHKIPVISNGVGENAIYGYTTVPKITVSAVTIAARGTIGYAAYRDYPYFPIIRLLSVIPINNLELNTKFLYYCLEGKKYNIPQARIPQLTVPTLKKVIIPLPPLEEQQRIVDILDRFDKLCNDISEGLPAEIDARQKQYEYYRDKLLTFKRLGE